MVSWRMGLLDEAIRDHLELKRRSGADAAEIANAERTALAPVFPDEPRPAAAEAQAGVDENAGHAAGAGAVTPLGDETVEIDMEAVMAEGEAARPAADAPPEPSSAF